MQVNFKFVFLHSSHLFPSLYLPLILYYYFIFPLCSHHLSHALTNTCLLHVIVAVSQTAAEHEACNKHLQEQLTEANQANEASQATQAKGSQSSDANTAGDVNHALQEELAKLKHEVFKHFLIDWYNLSYE